MEVDGVIGEEERTFWGTASVRSRKGTESHKEQETEPLENSEGNGEGVLCP